MALNKFMHPRNIYKNPPDFNKLAKTNADFAKRIKVDVTGKVSINFKDPSTLRILTICLLKSDFGLDVDIPEDRLVPTLPLRLNYILWLEDLMKAVPRDTNIRGIDIGTGACAIYPLLAATKNKWHMIGTEVDDFSLKKAQENIQKNNLQTFIELRKCEDSSLIHHLFVEDSTTYDFCMCNPPFYSNMQELCESRSPARLPPKNGFTGSPQELITEGGELEFCRKLIKESKDCKNNVLIFTTMVGHKYNLVELEQDLKQENIKHTHTEFCQGRVTRWGLAWTYQDYDLCKLLPPRDNSRKKSVPIIFQLAELPNSEYTVESAYSKLKHLLTNLNIEYNIINKRGNKIGFNIIARTNTWSNQRRKRRLARMEAESKKIKIVNDEDRTKNECAVNNSQQKLSESEQMDPVNIQKNHEHDNPLKKIGENEESSSIEELSNVFLEEKEPIVQAFLKLYKTDLIFLEMEYLCGSGGKDGLHQIMQYIKNNWK